VYISTVKKIWESLTRVEQGMRWIQVGPKKVEYTKKNKVSF
jgi:hypothetical protein